MEQKTIEALKWITSILDNNHIPYRIGGGLATSLYGSNRPVNDIDISLSGRFFSRIAPLVREFIVSGPKHYLNEKWDCTTFSLNYHEQNIDVEVIEINLEADYDVLLRRFDERVAYALTNPESRISNISKERFKELYDTYEQEKNLQAATIRTDILSPEEVIERVKNLCSF